MTENDAVLNIIEYTDPYCTWCWGSEPILRKIQEVYGSQVKIKFRMGGLVEDIRKFYDPYNKIGGANWYKAVAAHWLDASRRHGMPVDVQIWYDIKDEFRSTYPASIAYKSAELIDEELADRFLRRMREAAAAERKAIHRLEVQAELAEEVGLEQNKFLENIKNGKAEEAFFEDLRECRSRGITGFPTFLIQNSMGQEILFHGYHKFESFESAFRELAGNILEPNPIKVDNQSILAFIRKYGKVAPKEVSEVFDIGEESAINWLVQLKRKGYLKEQKAGNGFFYLIRNPFACDSDRGICSI